MSAPVASERVVAGVRLSNSDKLLYAGQGISKSDLAEYYLAIAPRMLPHVALRPITLVRCPTGRQRACFFQRHAGAGIPRQIEQMKVPGFDKPYLFIRDAPGLVALVQIGTLEIHPWGVSAAAPDRPDRLIFDLDPDEGLGFGAVIAAAREVRDRLAAYGLESFVKTTGGKGLHVVAPILPKADWKTAKAFAKRLSDEMAADAPDRYLTRISKAERAGRLFIDYLRNDATATAVAPYSTRAREGAPVAMPIAWEELVDGLDPAAFTVRTAAARAAQRSDPWADLPRLAKPLPS
jgi:bifunctional non-homologous end joining protein LigD